MVAGHLREKNGIYQIILTYKCEDGQRDETSMSTGIKAISAANRKKAEKMLLNARKDFVIPEKKLPKTRGKTTESILPAKDGTVTFFSRDKNQIKWCDFLDEWLKMIRSTIDLTTYSGYCSVIYNQIIPYFKPLELTLADIERNPGYIQDFYTYKLEKSKVSGNTVNHYHANIRKSLQYAFQIGLITNNPADRVIRPKKGQYTPSFYNAEDLERLFEVFRGDPLELAVIFGCYYGLRRSEIVGLKWNAIDFVNKTISIEHVVSQACIDHKYQLIQKDKTKTKKSTRTLPLVGPIESALVRLLRLQDHNKKLYGDSYCKDFLDYIYVDHLGNLMKPNYITQHFSWVLKKYDMKHIRFHDTRHSCASLLYANGVPMKDIQEWLGHSDISTTMNIYTHLDYRSKVSSANAIIGILPGNKKELLEAAN